jgi:hypothetical protein
MAEPMHPQKLAQQSFRMAALFCAAVIVLGGCTTAAATPSTGAPSAVATASEVASQQPIPTPTATATTAESAAESGISGTWSGTWTIDPPYSGTGGWSMTVEQTGNKFSGTVNLSHTDCSDGTVDGTVDGSKISIGFVVTPQPIQFEGNVNGTKMSGTWSSKACSDPKISLTGTWKGSKQG